MTTHVRQVPRFTSKLAFKLLTLGACASLAACSSSGSSSVGSSAASTGSAVRLTAAQSRCVSAVGTALRPYSSLPTALPANLTPLPAKPKPGGTIIKLVNGQLATDVVGGKALVAAAAAVGWTGHYVVYNGTIQDLNAKWQQAISEHPTAIVSSGPPAAAVSQVLAASKKAGIITDLLGATDTPGNGNDLTGVTLGYQSFSQEGVVNADLVLQSSHCDDPQIVVATLPFPALQAGLDGFSKTIKSECPACKITVQMGQVSQVGTQAATSAIVSAIQANPKIQYVYAVTGNDADGLPAALNAAGISGVKIFGSVPDNQSLQGLQNNTEAWWLTFDATIGGWLQMDTVLRIAASGGKPLTEGGNPIGVLTPRNVSKSASTLPVYPANFEALFKKLWHVG